MKMRYRTFGRNKGIDVSEIGIGGGSLIGLNEREVKEIIDYAYDYGINIIDLYMPEPWVRKNIGKAIKGKREKFIIQGHIGTIFKNNQYKRSRDIDEISQSFDELLEALDTDYIDYGMIHYIDTEEDWKDIQENGLWEYCLGLKSYGTIKHLGFSSHNPLIAKKIIETGEIDVMLFSINPAYDMDSNSKDDVDSLCDYKGLNTQSMKFDKDRLELYSLCQQKGIGITVMKAFGAGTLLYDKTSPFKKALTPSQCIKYCLDRMGVISVMAGFSNVEEVKYALEYFEKTDYENDYTRVITSRNFNNDGRCVYCNHCLPCPKNIDIAMVNKLLDIVNLSSVPCDTEREHYNLLKHYASECIKCGKCELNCPFGVEIRKKMQQAVKVFGK